MSKPETVGNFTIEPVDAVRWRFTNLLTGISHVYYGNREEAVESAQRQTEGWKRRLESSNGRHMIKLRP